MELLTIEKLKAGFQTDCSSTVTWGLHALNRRLFCINHRHIYLVQTHSCGLIFYQKKNPILMLSDKVSDNVSEELNGPVEPEPEQNAAINDSRIISVLLWKKSPYHLS